MTIVRWLASETATLILALFIGVIIWTAAVRANDPITTKSLVLEIQQTGLLPAEGDVTLGDRSVRITIEGPRSRIDPLRATDFQAFIDLSQISFGESLAAVQVTFSINEVNLVFQEPQQITVMAEEIVNREIPVSVTVNGDPARGHTLSLPIADPATILVSGRASRVNQLANAEITIFVDGNKEDIIQVRRPVFMTQEGRTASVTGLDLSTEEVIVTIPVQEIAGVAEKPIVVDWVGSPAPGYRLLDVTIEPDSVLVTGSPTAISNLTTLRTESIDISGLNESFEERVVLNLPEGIELDEVQPILVSFEIEPIRSTAVVRRVPEIRALGEGLEATLEPEQITVTLFGPIPALDSIQDADVTVTLDLLDLVTGTHTVAPIVNVLVSDVEVRSFQPELVTVNITITQRAMSTPTVIPTRTPTPAPTRTPTPTPESGYNPSPSAGWAAQPNYPFSTTQTMTVYRPQTHVALKPLRVNIL